MSDRRKQCGAGEGMYAHSEQRRNFQSKPLHESKAFSVLPPRPYSHRDARFSSRIPEPLGLQVQGFCCPLQQRAGSGRVTHRVAPQSRGGGDERLTLINTFKGIMGSRAKARASRAEVTPQGGGRIMCPARDPVSETAETPTVPCDNERQARHTQPGAQKVSELHLYLPSSFIEDEEQDAEAEETRPSAENTSVQESDVKPNKAGSPVSTEPTAGTF